MPYTSGISATGTKGVTMRTERHILKRKDEEYLEIDWM